MAPQALTIQSNNTGPSPLFEPSAGASSVDATERVPGSTAEEAGAFVDFELGGETAGMFQLNIEHIFLFHLTQLNESGGGVLLPQSFILMMLHMLVFHQGWEF
jgi:hypothetical protein